MYRKMHRKSGRALRVDRRREKVRSRPSFRLEALELRELLDAGGVLQGIVLDNSNAPLGGAIVKLIDTSDDSIAATAISGPSGIYTFSGVADGTYNIVETPPLGYVNSSADPDPQIHSPYLYAPYSPSVINNATIQVTVDSSNLYLHFDSFGAEEEEVDSAGPAFTGQYETHVDGNATAVNDTYTSANQLLTLCSDPKLSDTTSPGNIFQISLQASPAGTSAAQWGEVAYLYNHYGAVPDASTTTPPGFSYPNGTSSSTIADDNASALQIAVWKLLIDGDNSTFSTGTYQYSGTNGPPLGLVQAYYDDAKGRAETALYLAPVSSGQGMIAPEALDFTNSQIPVPTPGIQTTQQPANALVGESIADVANLSGLAATANSGDTVTFNLYSSATTQDASTLLFTDTENISINTLNPSVATATSKGYTVGATGTDYWVATFTPDAADIDDKPVTSPATAEPVNIDTISTSQQPASASIGSSIADTATVTGVSPTGTVTFNLYSNSTGTGTPLFTDANEPLVNGVATSKGYTASATGTDYWVATYNGDANNAVVSSGTASEPVNIDTITTSQQPASASVGSSIADTATVTGVSPTGTVTFNLYSNSTGTGTPLFTDANEPLVNGMATSKGYTATATGTDYWVATFNGDSNNSSVSSAPSSEPVTVTPASPMIATVPGEYAATVGTGQFATIGFWHNKNGQALINTFGPTPTSLGNSLAGSYANLFGAANNAYTGTSLAGLTDSQVAAVYENLWTPGGLQKNTYVQAFAVALGLYAGGNAGTYNVGGNGAAFGVANNTTLPITTILQTVSESFVPSTGLFYGNDSTLTGEANNVLNGINTSGETPGGGSVVTLVYLNDSATLSGGYNETGSITFYLMGPGATAATPLSDAVYTDTVTVTGNGKYSTPQNAYLPTATGTYNWVVVFTPADTNNNSATSPFGSEMWTVGQQVPAIFYTVPSPTAVTLSDAPVTLNDTAYLSDGVSPGGTITWTLYFTPAGGNTSTLVDTETANVSGNGSYTTPNGYPLPTSGTVTGTYQWDASYSGDKNNQGDSDLNDPAEQVTVSPASPSITTTPGGSVSVGTITISGTKYLDLTGNGFSGNDTPQAGVTINLYADTAGTGALQSGDALVASTTTASDGSYSFGVPVAGTYFVQESVPTGYVQTGGGPNGSAGNTYYTVVATAGNSYAGYNFDDYQIPTCQPTCVSYTVTHNGCATTVTNLAGNTHQGDTVTVTFTVPSGMNDTLTLVSYVAAGPSWSDSNAYQQQIYDQQSGTFSPGTHSLTVKIPNSYYQIDFICGLAIDQLEPNQNGDAYGPDSAEILYHAEGRFLSSDNGGTTAPSASSLNSQQPNSPSPTTSPNSASVLTDSATLSGGYNPGGTITFYLLAPGATASTPLSSAVYTDTVKVSGDGTYDTSMGNHAGGYLPTAAGTYQWVAVYSGDGNNNGVTSPFGSEPETVGPSSSSITTTPGGTVVIGCGSELSDTATLSGGVNPTGTITFYLFAPGVTPNASDSNYVYSDTVKVNGNGTYASGGYTPNVTGTYEWLAVYSGDCNNMQLVSNFGDEPESVLAATPVGAGGFATIGFWHNKNGQAVIDSFNGSSTSTTLGNWLASNFPNLFGASNSYISGALSKYGATSLAGLTNAQVAYVYEHLWTPSGVTKNTYVQAFAVALGMYADNKALGYDSTAAKYGFKPVFGGGGSETWKIGSNSGAFGNVSGAMTVLQVLQTVDGSFNSITSSFYNGNQTQTSEANNVLNGINTTGDITNADPVGAPAAGSGAVVYSSDQIRTAYGVNNLALDGTGQTIAIVDAYDNPSIFQSVDSFDQQMSTTTGGASLYTQYGSAASFLTVIGQDGSSTLPAADPSGNWELEEALDVEWIHAMAPGAQIILVEANSQSLSDLMASVATAANQPGVSVVSMSWGFTEGQSVLAADEAKYDADLTTPAGHQGVTFVASTGDYGAADPEYPAFSPNVVAVGGTSLYLNADNSYNNETGWGYYSDAMGVAIGGGGGVSLYEPEPAFQDGAQSTGFRTTPDVSMVADPATGVWLADTYNLDPSSPWEVVGGTSLAAPSWAAIIALADQSRVAAGGQTLGSAAATETQQALYALPVSDFNAVTTGSNGYSAGPGYNLVGGLGSPIANLLVPDLAAYAGSTAVPAGRIALTGAEATLSNTNFGTTNALAGTANAFAVSNVELASGLVFRSEVVSRQAEVGADAGGNLGAVGQSSSQPLNGEEMPGPAATAATTVGGSNGPTAAATLSLTRAEEAATGIASVDEAALDRLFAADDDEFGVSTADLLDLDSSTVIHSRRTARHAAAAAAQPSAGAAVGKAAKATPERVSGAARSTPSSATGHSWQREDAHGAQSAAASSATEKADQLAVAFDAMADKAAEAARGAYESLVDTIFGLLG